MLRMLVIVVIVDLVFSVMKQPVFASQKKTSGACTSGQQCGSAAVDAVFPPSPVQYSCEGTTTRVCTQTPSKGVGDICVAATDCAGNSPCTGGICVGVALAGICVNYDDTDNCAWGLYCNGGTCAANLAAGAACTYSNQCGAYTGVCSAAGTCIALNSVADGSACSDDDACLETSYCKTAQDTNSNVGVCYPKPTSSIACFNDTGCAATGDSCFCTGAGLGYCGDSITSDVHCVNKYAVTEACVIAHSCKGACSACLTQYGCYLGCVYGNNPIYAAHICETPPAQCDAVTTSVAFLVLLIAFFVAL